MAKFNLDDYVQVNERIAEFRSDPAFKGFCIQTELTYPDDTTVRCQAAIFASHDDTRPTATGHAEEKRTGMINSTSAVENCETSAVGRALRHLGVLIGKGPSREEMEKVQRMTDPSLNGSEVIGKLKEDLDAAEVTGGLTDLQRAIEAYGASRADVKQALGAMGVRAQKKYDDTLASLTREQGEQLLKTLQMALA